MGLRRIVIGHYHYLPGGVTSVVRNMINSLGNRYEFILCCDRSMGVTGLGTLAEKKNVRFCDIPEIGYRDPAYYSSALFEKEKAALRKVFGKLDKKNTLFWMHNHHLGKNPALTAAVEEFSREGESPLLLQIHDFPECGRWSNYQFLKQYAPAWYPISPRVFYAAINKRDHAFLKEAGVPDERLFYLPNSVTSSGPMMGENKQKAREKVRKFVLSAGFRYDDKAPLLVYPVRTIRRKNVLEAFLLSFIGQCNLIVTLPANSEPERPYERVVAAVAREPFFRGGWALSRAFPESFPWVLSGADLTLSTSVMEGFGLFFLEAKQRGSNFWARALSVMDDFPQLTRESLYETVPVPARLIDRPALLQAYEAALYALPLPHQKRRHAAEKMIPLLEKDNVDFSCLDVLQQQAILKEREKRELMRESLGGLKDRMLLFAGDFRGQGIDLQSFSQEAYAGRLGNVLQSMFTVTGETNSFSVDSELILDRFLIPENMKLLLSYKGEEE